MSKLDQKAIDDHIDQGSWRVLERAAYKMIADVQARTHRKLEYALGGGTRLMLALRHRISHDIDLFIQDPQWITYFSPRLNDDVAVMVHAYDEGSDMLRLEMAGGEIDFIVCPWLITGEHNMSPLTDMPLEATEEVMAKKLYYRGALMTPRDLFDWYAIEQQQPGTLQPDVFGRLLRHQATDIRATLDILKGSLVAQRQWQAIQAPVVPDLASTVDWAAGRLSSYLAAASEP